MSLGQQPHSAQRSQSNSAHEVQVSRITSFKFQRPNLVVIGSYLSRVEICGVPSGTEISPDACDPLGNATRRTGAGERERWVLALPPYPVNYMVTEVYAKAYDANSRVVGRKSLSVLGVSAISDAFYPPANPNLFSHQSRIGLADSGKRFIFADNNWQFSIVLDEAKYPATEFTLDCRPKYGKTQAISQTPKKMQEYYSLPGTAYYTNLPGTCIIKNGDFAVTIEVLHGDWRE